jgi:hypothetical protein
VKTEFDGEVSGDKIWICARSGQKTETPKSNAAKHGMQA